MSIRGWALESGKLNFIDSINFWWPLLNSSGHVKHFKTPVVCVMNAKIFRFNAKYNKENKFANIYIYAT